jgi:hypothetical protein
LKMKIHRASVGIWRHHFGLLRRPGSKSFGGKLLAFA